MGINLPPGPELDALVLQHVFEMAPCAGWRYRPGTFGLSRTCNHNPGECFSPRHPAPVSSEIAAAWQLVERLAILHNGVEVKRWGEDYHECRVWERITPEMIEAGRANPPEEWTRMGETTPHAICLAALDAVGYKED